MGLAEQVKDQAVPAVVASGGSGLLGAAIGLIGARRQYKYNKKLMALQQKFARENFQLENDRQDWLLQHQAAIEKEGLRNAGYSTADPEGVGVSPVGSSNVSAPSNGSVSWNPPSFDLAGSAYTLSQARLADSQSALNEIEARYRAKILEGTVGKLNVEIETMSKELPLKIATMKQELVNLGQTFNLQGFQIEAAEKEVDRLGEVIKGLRIDNKYKEDLNVYQVKKLKNEVYILAKEGKVKDLEAKLAEYGILANADGLTNIFGVLAVDGSGKIMDALRQNVATLFSGLPGFLADIFPSIFDGIAEAGKSGYDWLKKKFKGLFE